MQALTDRLRSCCFDFLEFSGISFEAANKENVPKKNARNKVKYIFGCKKFAEKYICVTRHFRRIDDCVKWTLA